MVALEQTEIAALLALIAWHDAEDGAALPHDAGRDAELNSASRKLKARPSSVTLRLDAARKSRENAIEERTMLLSWLTRLLPATDSHLAPVVPARPSSDWNWVVCIHAPTGPMSWRISDHEAENYFKRLKRHACELGNTKREDKLARLSKLIASKR